MGLLGKGNGKDVVSSDNLPKPSTTHPQALFEIRPTEEGAVFVIHTRNSIEGFPMELAGLEAFTARCHDVIRHHKAPALSLVEDPKEVILPDGAAS